MANIGAGEYNVQTGEGMVTNELKRMHGLSPDDELTLERSISFYHPEDQPTIREAFTEAVEAGEPYDLELRLITADDEQRWVHMRGEPQGEDGEIVRVRGTIQDVTERVRRREKLETAKEAAEEADRIKSALLSNMNHEFRTPLTSIITFSELIRDDPDVAGRFVDRILGGGQRLLYTLNTVMDFAELEADDRSVTVAPVQLREVVRSVVNDFREQARRKEIDLSVEVPEHMSSVVLDRYRVERILTHLLHNAIKFTDEGSVTVAADVEDEVVTLQVTDTGVGIDPAFQSQVFDEFAQQSSGYDRTHEGNGLGLTVVKRYVDEMGGEIDLDSEPGDGTRVTVRLSQG
jgi:PAS domain S-box-containing protein